MANRKLIHDLDVSEIDVLLEEDFSSAMETWILQANTVYEPNKIVEGRDPSDSTLSQIDIDSLLKKKN